MKKIVSFDPGFKSSFQEPVELVLYGAGRPDKYDDEDAPRVDCPDYSTIFAKDGAVVRTGNHAVCVADNYTTHRMGKESVSVVGHEATQVVGFDSTLWAGEECRQILADGCIAYAGSESEQFYNDQWMDAVPNTWCVFENGGRRVATTEESVRAQALVDDWISKSEIAFLRNWRPSS